MSLITYFSSPQHNWISNIANVIDTVVVSAIFLTVSLKGKRQQWNFSKLEIFCLGASAATIPFWLVSGKAEVSNAAFQTVMVIAYAPLVRRLLKALENPESFSVWGISLCAALAAFLPAAIDHDVLAMVYSGRAAICVSLVLVLILRLKTREIRPRA